MILKGKFEVRGGVRSISGASRNWIPSSSNAGGLITLELTVERGTVRVYLCGLSGHSITGYVFIDASPGHPGRVTGYLDDLSNTGTPEQDFVLEAMVGMRGGLPIGSIEISGFSRLFYATFEILHQQFLHHERGFSNSIVGYFARCLAMVRPATVGAQVHVRGFKSHGVGSHCSSFTPINELTSSRRQSGDKRLATHAPALQKWIARSSRAARIPE